MSLLNDLSIDNLEVLNEFDAKSFIDISSINLGRDMETSQITFSTEKYVETLVKAINSMNDVSLNYKIRTILDDIARFNIRANEINSSEIITINTDPLDNYIKSIAKMLDDVYKGEATKDSVDKITSSFALEAIKKAAVKTSFEQPNVIKLFKFRKDNEYKVVNIDNSYVRKRIVPFIDNYNSKHADLSNEIGNVCKQIQKESEKLNNIISTMNKIKVGESTPIETKEKLTYAMYYGLRNALEVISYITAMAIQKIELFTRNTMICNEITSQVENRTDIIGVNESYGAHVGVVPTDEESIGDALRNGDISAFKILANNIYGLHINDLKHPDIPEGVDEVGVSADGQYLQGYIKYKKDVYEAIIKDLIEIGQGVDFLTGRLDQYIMITDDLVNSAGFVMSLFDRYASDLNAIEDMTSYDSVLNLNPTTEILNGLYQTILSEIHDYDKNMQAIANSFQDCGIRLQALRKLLTVEHNGEFNTSEPMIQLQDWLSNFEVEFGKFAGSIGVKFLARLKDLGEELNNIKLSEEPPTENTGDELDIDKEESANIDFIELAYESAYDMEVLEHQYITHMLELEYYTEKELLNNKILMAEADAPNQTNPQQKVSTTPKVVDPNSGSSFINKIIESIKTWFNKIRDSFANINRQLVASPRGKAVAANINNITSRDFTNVSVTMLPYDNIDADRAVVDGFNKLGERIRNLTPQDIQNIKAKEDLYTKIFGFIPGGIDKNSSPADQIRNYYKTGDKANSSTMKTFTNNELKTFITAKMAPYVTGYGNNITTTVNNAATNFDKILSDKIKSLSTVAPSTINESVMTEALNPNTTISMGTKGRWIASLAQIFAGAAYNALRDRYKDYVKALYPLIPQENLPQVNQNQQVQQQTQQIENQAIAPETPV